MRSWLDLFCFGGMSTARRAVLLRVGLLVALVGAFLGAAPSFAVRGTLVAVAPKMNTMLNQVGVGVVDLTVFGCCIRIILYKYP